MTRNEVIKAVVRIILKSAKPARIYLYGSEASNNAKKTSDIDIVYDDRDFQEHHLIEEEIAKLKTLVKVDVRNIAFSEARFRNRVVATGKVLYSSNKKLRAEDALHNFSRALARFSTALGQRKELEREGFADIYPDLMMQRFEFTYEMAWKALKRYLSYVGIECSNPRACFQEAFAQEILEDENIWLDMIEKRNISSHTYDESEIRSVLQVVESYRGAFETLKDKLDEKLGEVK